MAEQMEIPKNISPKDFFEKFVPEQFEKNKGLLPQETRSLSVTAVIELKGDQGGIWTICMSKGNISISPGDSPDRIVKVVQSVADWRSAISGERGFKVDMTNIGSANMGGQAVAPMSQEKIDQLKDIEGALMFQSTHPEKGNWEITAHFGKTEKEQPDCTIIVSDETFVALQKGETNPPMAFMQGLVKIQGDMGLAMRIGTTMMA